MKCSICNSDIPTRLRIEDKVFNLQSRTKCLNCLPFKSLESKSRKGCNSKFETTVLTCKRCFKTYDKGHGSYKDYCKSCRVTIQRQELKQKAVVFLGGKCSICGYDRCLKALQFHHKNPEEKDFSIGERGLTSWDTIKPELEKCQLVCANCHAELHSD